MQKTPWTFLTCLSKFFLYLGGWLRLYSSTDGTNGNRLQEYLSYFEQLSLMHLWPINRMGKVCGVLGALSLVMSHLYLSAPPTFFATGFMHVFVFQYHLNPIRS